MLAAAKTLIVEWWKTLKDVQLTLWYKNVWILVISDKGTHYITVALPKAGPVPCIKECVGVCIVALY